MSENPTVTNPSDPSQQVPDAGEPKLPAWVPVLIGGVLVTMAGLAVYTGLRYRDNTLVAIVKPQKRLQTPVAVAPPGEPEAGASLIFPGTAGDNAPAAHPSATGSVPASIAGASGATGATVRFSARRGMQLSITPADAVVYVNDLAIGLAKQFNSIDEIYDFPATGTYNIRIVAPGYRDRSFVVAVSETAKSEIARIDAKLEKQ